MPIKKPHHHTRVFNGHKMVYRIRHGKGVAMPDEMPSVPLAVPKLTMPTEDKKLQRQKIFAELLKKL